jgi:hypothetical protein
MSAPDLFVRFILKFARYSAALGCAIWLVSVLATACFADPAETTLTTYQARDTLGAITSSRPDALACLKPLAWQPGKFQVTCETKPGTAYDHLVRFPSPVPSGIATNDSVSMEWYVPRDVSEATDEIPAVLVVHESGKSMPVGRLFARSFQAAGFHAFLIHLPYYGERRSGDHGPDGSQLFVLIRQAIADVRRGRDAIVSLPGVDRSLIALQGTSLGGFVVATAASLDRSFDCVFIALAGGKLYEMLMSGQKDTAKARRELEQEGFSGDRLKQLLWRIEPTRVAHRLDPHRTWLYTAEKDQVVPIANAMALARAAGLDADHHVRVPANHYTAIAFFPVILQHMTDQLRVLSAAEDSQSHQKQRDSQDP